ncbi:hypothetical protein BYT27DRAFT_7019123, partial [Phlegmacium glaucopus]
LDKVQRYNQLLKGGFSITSDHDTEAIIEARTRVDELKEKLLREGGWGAIILDYGMFDSNIQQFELMALPMFDEIKLVNFHRLDKWHNIASCWLNIFLKFARDSYRYIAFPTNQNLQSLADVMDKEASTMDYTFDFLNTSFHKIIDEAYKTHLAPEYRAHLSVLVTRVTYLLDKGCQEYPCISNLHVPLPLACNTFIQDLGQDLYQWELPMFEFLTLFEPTIAMRYGYKKKGFEFTKTNKLDDHKAEIQQCLQILLSSHHSWSAQCSSTPHQHHLGLAISTMQLHKDKHIYQYYLGEDINYISYDVNVKLRELYQTLAKECVHQAFQFEQDERYLPPEQIESSELDQIIKT